MQPYQEEYIKNCQTIRTLSALHTVRSLPFDEGFSMLLENLRQARKLSQRNTYLLMEFLLPLLDNLYGQKKAVLLELEAFADALIAAPQVLDVSLACQIDEALLSCARQRKNRETVIRMLYKVGMARHGYWQMLFGNKTAPVEKYVFPMQYCFMEASSYLKYFDEFESEETKGYILRSLANLYLGNHRDWRERLRCVRHTMQVFSDERYRASAPGLPWDKYVFTIHRQMVSVLPHGKVMGGVAPDEVVDIMESAHIIYAEQYEKARKEGRSVRAEGLVTYYALERNCGLLSNEKFFRALEELLDEVDVTKYDADMEYKIVAMPAYYVVYLSDGMKELVEPRKDYITSLYKRMLRYVKAMPPEQVTSRTSMRCLLNMSSFIEIEGGVTYGAMALAFLAILAPDLYAHSHVVGEMARAICQTICAEEPGFFDDIPDFSALSEGEEKRKAISEYAYGAGMLHDIGRLNFVGLYSHAGRQMLHREEELLELHSNLGQTWLAGWASTRRYADIALGHHRWYDGSDGYPEEYHRGECPYRAMVDVISLADFLDRDEDDDAYILVHAPAFRDRLSEAEGLAGRRFSPMVTGWLRDQTLVKRLEELYRNGRREGYYRCFLRSEEESHMGS